jgi:hypothetical protein
MMAADTYDDVRRAIDDSRTARGVSNSDDRRFPEWLKLALAALSVIVTVTLAYAALDKRIALVEQKLDFIVQQVQVHRP